MLAKRIWLSISGSLVSIAMSGKMKVNLYGIFRVQNGGLPKVGGPVRPNTLSMPKAGPGSIHSLDILPVTQPTALKALNANYQPYKNVLKVSK